jgi:hypothetical protein
MKYRHGPWAVDEHASLPEACSVAGGYALIIGSDILYERDEKSVLAGFIGRHASMQAEVWIVDPDRGNRPAFNRQMAGLGFERSEVRLDQAASSTCEPYKGRMLTYCRAAGDSP